MRYYIIAGEASGDLHGSSLMKGLYECDPHAQIRFWGGDRMLSVYESHPCEGGGLARDYRAGAIMGFVEVLVKARKLLGNLSDCKKDILAFQPDVVILIDYPGFNLQIAQWAHSKGLKVFYYIAPKVWASREGRIEKLRRYVDMMFIVFPFEKAYFDSKNLPYIYCGNPLVDAVADSPALAVSRDELRKSLGLDKDKPLIAMLAGSRMGEISTMMPLIRETVDILSATPALEGCQFVIAGAPGRKEEDYGEFDRKRIRIVFGKTQEVVRAADAAMINSGTASLEAVLLDTPQVVAYRVKSKISYWLAKNFLFKGSYISLGNLCLNKLAFKELYRYEDCIAPNIAAELKRIMTDSEYRQIMLDDYAQIRASLGEKGASKAVAARMVELLSGKR